MALCISADISKPALPPPTMECRKLLTSESSRKSAGVVEPTTIFAVYTSDNELTPTLNALSVKTTLAPSVSISTLLPPLI